MAYALGYFAAGFLLAGFSEVLIPLFGVGLVILWTATRYRKIIPTLAGLGIGFAVVILAPGNAVRAAALPPRMPLFVTLTQALKLLGLFFIGEILNHLPALLLAFCVGYLCPLKADLRRKWLWVEVSLLATVMIVVYSLFIPLELAGGLTERHFTTASFTLIANIGFIGMLCGSE